MKIVTRVLVPVAALSLAACSGNRTMDDMPDFGGRDSVKYARQLWDALEDAAMIGPDAAVSRPYKGLHPHGAVLDTVSGEVTVDGHTGIAIVKRNYGGENASIRNVAADPQAYLRAITVMYRRESGYDSDNKDWFWARYLVDGSLDKDLAGIQLAGRVAKGRPVGCIACHVAAPGGDMVFDDDRF